MISPESTSLEAGGPRRPLPTIGDRVLCREGSPMGRVRQILASAYDPRFVFVIVNLGSCPRVGEDCRPVPVDALHPEPPSAWRLRIADEHVRAAPIHVRGVTTTDVSWWMRVHRHYETLAREQKSASKH